MKKSQRSRFHALLAKTNLTAAEQTELLELQKLASQHPNASDDVDDEKKEDDDTDASKKSADEEEEEDPEKKDDEEKPEASSSIFALLRSAFSKKPASAVPATSADLTAANARATAAESRATKAEGQVADLTKKNSALDSSLNAFAALFTIIGFKPTEVKGATGGEPSAEELTTAIQTQFNAHVAKRADEKLALVGFPAAKLPSATKDAVDEKEMTHAEFSKLSPGAKMEFCAKGGKVTELPLNLAGKN